MHLDFDGTSMSKQMSDLTLTSALGASHQSLGRGVQSPGALWTLIPPVNLCSKQHPQIPLLPVLRTCPELAIVCLS